MPLGPQCGVSLVSVKGGARRSARRPDGRPLDRAQAHAGWASHEQHGTGFGRPGRLGGEPRPTMSGVGAHLPWES